MTMDPQTHARLEARAAILKALAHPTRLFFIEELSRGERCVCELQAMVGADMSTVSKHLSVLKAVGIVADRRQGASVYYRLQTPCILDLFGCLESASRCHIARQLEALS